MTRAHNMLIGAIVITVGCGGSAGGVNIWEAIEKDDAMSISAYSDASGDLNIRNVDGETPLFRALSLKHFESYKTLLECGADPNIIMNQQRVVTHWAATEPDSKWLQLALEHGADPNLVNIGSGPPNEGTPFHFAITSSHIDNIKLLIQYGADINKPDHRGCSPITKAVRQNDFDVVMLLLDNGADYKSARCGGKTFHEIMDERKRIQDKFFERPEVQQQLTAIHNWLEDHK